MVAPHDDRRGPQAQLLVDLRVVLVTSGFDFADLYPHLLALQLLDVIEDQIDPDRARGVYWVRGMEVRAEIKEAEHPELD